MLAALAAAAVLLLHDPRRRPWAMVAAGALAALGLATLVDSGITDDVRDHAALVALAAAGAGAAVVGLALLRARPAAAVRGARVPDAARSASRCRSATRTRSCCSASTG